ncbi:hypothetical protein [Paenibacillus illinoisensis]|uniref:hypothetical protein n=1 Tax=Paenibacillus illinoisensis TaxID=59845 RepID=UPI000FD6E688|nr:hypothetical protein [Paenibacillus illinoisensis]
MRIKKVLELSIDVEDIVNEVPQVLKALLDTMPNRDDKLGLLLLLKQDVDHFLKGAETNGQPIREPGREQADQ